MGNKLFDYDNVWLQVRKPTTAEKVVQKFSPQRLAAVVMIEFQKLTNEHIDLDELRKDYPELKYDKIIAFKYSDMPLAPFYFTVNAGQLLLLKEFNGKPTTELISDLNTVINIVKGNVSMAKARLDGRIIIRGERIAHDDAMFFEIFDAVAPHLRKKIGVNLH